MTSLPQQGARPQLDLRINARLGIAMNWQTVVICTLTAIAWGAFAVLSID